jgi:hypothetical protein
MPSRPYDDRDDNRFRREDDRPGDYRDDRPRQAAPASGGGSALPIVAIIGGVLALVLLVCGGVVFYIIYSFQQAGKQMAQTGQQMTGTFAKAVEKQNEEFERMNKNIQAKHAQDEQERKEKEAEARKATQFANTFVGEAKNGRIANAYGMTTASFRRRVSQKEFADQVKEDSNTLRAMGALAQPGDPEPPYQFANQHPSFGKWTKLELTVIKAGDDFKVEQFSIGSHDPFKK